MVCFIYRTVYIILYFTFYTITTLLLADISCQRNILYHVKCTAFICILFSKTPIIESFTFSIESIEIKFKENIHKSRRKEPLQYLEI